MFDSSFYDNPTPLAHADTSRDVLPRGGTSQWRPTRFNLYDPEMRNARGFNVCPEVYFSGTATFPSHKEHLRFCDIQRCVENASASSIPSVNERDHLIKVYELGLSLLIKATHVRYNGSTSNAVSHDGFKKVYVLAEEEVVPTIARQSVQTRAFTS
ncbi:uncharacterized protein TNCV_2836671 [Trichonephila clavipes]|nr:uncharacterized protein TNCV_2836671 [Trichonephila clavipes]